MKHCCRNCHFLVKGRPDYEDNFKTLWDKEDRRKGQIKEKKTLLPFCSRGVWQTDGVPKLLPKQVETKLRKIIDKNRKDDCFFIEYSEGMSFDGAAELHHIRYENRQLKRSLTIAVWGLYISAFAALLNFIGFENLTKL